MVRSSRGFLFPLGSIRHSFTLLRCKWSAFYLATILRYNPFCFIGMPIASCVSSNLATGAVATLRSHPVRQLFEQAVLITINSDDPSMFNTSISREYELLNTSFDMMVDEIKQLVLNGIIASFLADKEKLYMIRSFTEEFHSLRKNI